MKKGDQMILMTSKDLPGKTKMLSKDNPVLKTVIRQSFRAAQEEAKEHKSNFFNLGLTIRKNKENKYFCLLYAISVIFNLIRMLPFVFKSSGSNLNSLFDFNLGTKFYILRCVNHFIVHFFSFFIVQFFSCI